MAEEPLFSQEELQKELDDMAARNDAAGGRVTALRERLAAFQHEAKATERQVADHVAVIAREREALKRDLATVNELMGRFDDARAIELSGEVHAVSGEVTRTLDEAETALGEAGGGTDARASRLEALGASLSAIEERQSDLGEKIAKERCKEQIEKLIVVQLYLLLLSLENDLNELRKDMLELIQIFQGLVIIAMGLKMLAMQLTMLLMMLQAILTKILILLIPRGPQGPPGPQGPQGPPGPPGTPPRPGPWIDLTGPTSIQSGQGAILSYDSAGLNHVHLEYATDPAGPWTDLGQGGALSLSLGLALVITEARDLPVPRSGVVWTPAMTGRIYVRALGQDPSDVTIASDTISFMVS